MINYEIVASYCWVSLDDDDKKSPPAVVGKVTAPDAETALTLARQQFSYRYFDASWSDVQVYPEGQYAPAGDRYNVWGEGYEWNRETNTTGTGVFVLLGSVWATSDDNARRAARQVFRRQRDGQIYNMLAVVAA